MFSSMLMNRGLAILVLGLLSACASLQVHSYVAEGVDVRSYRTYAWDLSEARPTGDPRLDNNELFATRVRATIDKEMAAKGFEQIVSGAPDLLVHYHASVTQKIDVRTLDAGDKYGSTHDSGASVFDVGTLFIDFDDPRTRRLVWRGWAEGSLEGVIDDQTLMESRIDDAVARILRRLPRGL